MNIFPPHIVQLLDKRKKENAFRSLKAEEEKIDFCSNDYLGASRSKKLYDAIQKEIATNHLIKNGSTGSRLLAGNTAYAEELEKYIANFHHAEEAIIFNSGYDANVGLFSSIAGKDDTIICDELIHASIIDGCRLSKATRYKFRHNNLDDLKQKINSAKGTVFIAVESAYSMDGDIAPLKELVQVAKENNSYLIVDEAHASGIFGKQGRGVLNELGLEEEVFARIHTYGKAMGVHGAAVVGPGILKDYLINFARSFIYSTALPAHSLAAIRCSYQWIKENETEREKLKKNIEHFRNEAKNLRKVHVIESDNPIQSVLVPGNKECRKAASALQQKGFDIRPILSPTVAEGKERLRICLHSFNTSEEINAAMKELALCLAQQ